MAAQICRKVNIDYKAERKEGRQMKDDGAPDYDQNDPEASSKLHVILSIALWADKLLMRSHSVCICSPCGTFFYALYEFVKCYFWMVRDC